MIDLFLLIGISSKVHRERGNLLLLLEYGDACLSHGDPVGARRHDGFKFKLYFRTVVITGNSPVEGAGRAHSSGG